jgi:hypothetical protein
MIELTVFKIYKLDAPEKLIKINNGGLHSQELQTHCTILILTSVITTYNHKQSMFKYRLLVIL